MSLNDVRAELSGTYLEEVFEGEEIYESLETRLDACALRNLYASSASLLSEDGKILQDFVLRRVAVLTVVRQWRLRVSYGWSYERTQAYRNEICSLFGGIAWPQLKTVERASRQRHEEWGKGVNRPRIPPLTSSPISTITITDGPLPCYTGIFTPYIAWRPTCGFCLSDTEPFRVARGLDSVCPTRRYSGR